MNRTSWPLVFCITALFTVSLKSAVADEPRPDVRVMSYNIRYGTAEDGDNHWNHRREALVKAIRAFDPDLLGTQETLAFQRDYLRDHLPGYTVIGVGRDDGQERGEMMALYFKQDRFEQLDSGHFWLSETPEVAGSRSWDSSLPRMVTWVKLHDRLQDAAPPILFLNTHFDHRGPTARVESARLLRRMMMTLGEHARLIVTGDFNTGEATPPYDALFGTDDGQRSPVVDSYRVVHPEREANEATFTAFRPDATHGDRIDWIGVSRDWEIRAVEIDRTTYNGRMPSDHFSVTAVLR